MTHLAPVILAARMLMPADPLPTDPPPPVASDSSALSEEMMDSVTQAVNDHMMASFTFQHGQVAVGDGVATLDLPVGFKFLDKDQSANVITKLWGNPDASGVLGIIFPEQDDVMQDSSYAFVVQYDEIGYVKDDDADDINYDDLMKDLKSGEVADNAERVEQGYDPAYLIGWASKPFYDKEHRILHWAKEIKFGDSAVVNTLNYNVRVLGRKGVLVLNAVASMSELPLVQQHVPDVLSIVKFSDGYKYEQYDSNVDKVAAYTIGGLVAGKVLAKVGIFAILAKFAKVIFAAIVAGAAAIWRFISGRKKKDETLPAPTVYKP